MATAGEAELVIQKLNQTLIDGKTVSIKYV
jgi:hypothetical protein